jgi:cytochrome c biogenesis protein CcdA/thiol-disulfide isomerase/thioredoxin
MILALAVFLGGVLTILSPCIMPVLPFVFARSERKFSTNGLPLLVGMTLAFAGIATLATVGGSWAVRLNQYGRVVSLILLTVVAATLLSRTLADWLARPFVALGNRLLPAANGGGEGSVLSSLLLGAATGLLWAPCAGPILGLVLTGAAISGPNTHTSLLLLAYAAGAATSLGVAIFAGRTLFATLKKSFGVGEWIRRVLGVCVLLGVVAIAFGWDTSILTRLSLNGTNRLEQSLLDRIQPARKGGDVMAMNNSMAPSNSMAMSNSMMMSPGATLRSLPVEGDLPSLSGATAWLNSPPLDAAALRGKVVLVDFWTYSCINCLRSLPYIKSWYERYKDHGLVVVGVHAPEFAFEKDEGNVRRAIKDLGIAYPVAMDNDYAIWQGFDNHYWPAHYFIDAMGKIRGHHFGEGEYGESEQTLRELLTQAGYKDLPPAIGDQESAVGVQAAADENEDQSPETYVGYARAKSFVSPGGFAEDHAKTYALPASLGLNEWGLAGRWNVASQEAVSEAASGRLSFRFRARDLHLVMGPAADGKPLRFRVQIDGADPGPNHGVDTDAGGNGIIKEERLYQLIRQAGAVGEHTFSIEFPDAGAQVYSFTFG